MEQRGSNDDTRTEVLRAEKEDGRDLDLRVLGTKNREESSKRSADENDKDGWDSGAHSTIVLVARVADNGGSVCIVISGQQSDQLIGDFGRHVSDRVNWSSGRGWCQVPSPGNEEIFIWVSEPRWWESTSLFVLSALQLSCNLNRSGYAYWVQVGMRSEKLKIFSE